MLSKIIRLNFIRSIYKVFSYLNTFIVDKVLSSIRFRALIKNSGKKSYCHYSVEIKYGDNITIGDYTRIGPNSTLGAMETIDIGSNVVISKEVFIETAGLDFKSDIFPYQHKGKKIVIHDNVWIGARAIILGGVQIGKNSIIGAGVVVSKSVPENSIVVGQQPRVMDIRH
jgi:acetyltransferase-like isoleucine patch superfamily enzyme